MRVKRFVLPNAKTGFCERGWRRICSYIYAYLPIGYLLVGLHSLLHRKKRYKYDVSLCLIFKNEAPYLKEWLEFYILIGVDHFYLYNNNSTDNFAEVLQPYIRDGRVTLTDWERDYCQVGAYEHCYRSCKDETHWLGFLDTDEFLNISVEEGNDVKKLLKKYEAWPSLFLFWRMFGTSGIMKEDCSKLVIERFTSCWPYLSNEGKSFINNDYEFSTINVHWHKAKYLGVPLYGVMLNKMFDPYMELVPCRIKPKAYINHYWSRSREYAIFKTFVRTDVLCKDLEKTRKKNGLDFFELQCSAKDFSIQRLLVNLKEALSIDNIS